MNTLKKIKRFILSMRQRQKIPIVKETSKKELLMNREAIITGGTGDIGRVIASSFIECGAVVYLVGRNLDKLKKVSEELGENCHYYQMDITDINDMEGNLLNLFKKSNHKIDILVNSAGALTKEKFGTVTEETWDSVIDTNLKGTFFLSQTISNYWIKNKIRGNILNISSGSGLKPGWTPYQISKKALDSATIGMAQFLIDYGIVVNSIAPGPVFSNMQGKVDVSSIDDLDNPTGRLVTPIEIGEWAVYMVSTMGQYAVGSNLHLTGGNGIFQFEER